MPLPPLVLLLLLMAVAAPAARPAEGHDYGDALRKCILFFEGQRSGKLPPDQRLRWRGDSALRDGAAEGVSKAAPAAVPSTRAALAIRRTHILPILPNFRPVSVYSWFFTSDEHADRPKW